MKAKIGDLVVLKGKVVENDEDDPFREDVGIVLDLLNGSFIDTIGDNTKAASIHWLKFNEAAKGQPDRYQPLTNLKVISRN